MFDIDKVRKDFPILSRKVNDHELIYLDSAATTLKPKPVIDAITQYYTMETANVHRGVHFLSNLATDKYESAREKLRAFINADSLQEVIFTRGTTDAINLVAQSYGENFLSEGDEILFTQMEHHSNLVPWQILAERKKLKVKFVKISTQGELDLDDLRAKISAKTKIFAFNYISNSLGSVNPIKEMITMAKSVGCITVIDAAQALAHIPIDVQDLDCDFMAFSAHKALGPTGIGALYGKKAHLESMPPLQGGGDMISTVKLEKSTWNDLPFKFEAGTPHIAGVIGFGAAIEYLNSLGLDNIKAYEDVLQKQVRELLLQIDGIQLIGDASHKANIFSFVIKGIHGTDLGTILDQEGIAVRTGHHCTMPVMEFFKVPGSARASFGCYNTIEEARKLKTGIEKAISFLR